MMELEIMGFIDFGAEEKCYSEPPTMSEWTIQMNDET